MSYYTENENWCNHFDKAIKRVSSYECNRRCENCRSYIKKDNNRTSNQSSYVNLNRWSSMRDDW